MLALALAVVLSAEPSVATSTTITAEEPSSRVVLSTYPLAPLVGAGVFLATAGGPPLGTWLPVGVQVSLSPRWVVDVEVSAMVGLSGFNRVGWAVTASAGPTWFPFAEQRGFFIGPRFNFLIGEAVTRALSRLADGPLDMGPFVRRSFLWGFDAGWQFRKGRVVFGPVVGASIGLSYDSGSVLATPFEARTVLRSGVPERSLGVGVGLNLTLFRLGVAL